MSVNADVPRRSWAPLAVLVAAQFMVILDISIVNVALPSIGGALDVAPGDLSWIVTAYVICSGGLLLVGGRAADAFGRRRTFLTGLGTFTLASLACGLAPSLEVLVAARVAQGIGAAVLTPSALALVTATYTGAQRTTALSIWGAIASAGIAVGVVLGGVLTSGLSWHWIFLVNVPVGAAAAALTLRVVPDAPPVAAARALDLPGAAAAVGGLALLVYALSGVDAHGWGSARTIGLLAAAGALLAGFAAIERVVARPLVPPGTMRVRPLAGGMVLMLGATGLLAGWFFVTSLHLQADLGWSALRAGLSFLPFVVAIAAGVHVTQHAIAQAGSRTLVAAGLLLAGAGAALLGAAPPDPSYAGGLLPGFVVFGLGMGVAFPAISISAMHHVGHDDAGLASGLMSTAHEVGAALGVAVLSAVATGSAGQDGALTTAAVIAAVLAAGAATAMPSVRPAPGAHVAVH